MRSHTTHLFDLFKYFYMPALLLALCFNSFVFSQSGGADKEYNGRLSRAFIKSPVLLANALTRNKNTDTEKFEAIYNWVVKNINYNYGIYFSGGSVTRPDFKKILTRQKGVCLDYTFLMDTLCYMAGITNVSVFGYAKDELFDVKDSTYIDNHAWNAVKLDNLWYLYDITWSKGFMYYRYTKFSRFIINLKERFTVKYIPKIVKQKNKRYFRKLNCGAFASVDNTPNPVVVYKRIYRHKLLRKLLSRFKLKIIRSYKEESNTNFYLADPKVFAITHFPDDPDWSLLPRQGIRDFECDSAFYDLSAYDYETQQRRGWSCSGCGNDLSLSPMEKNLHMMKQSSALNPRNRFITSLCEYNIGGLKLEESLPVEDSLAKVTLLDTAMAFMEHARLSLWHAMRNIGTEHYLQTSKNSKKLSDVLDDNLKHRAFIRSKMEISFRETNNIRDLESKVNINANRYYYRNRIINHYKHGNEINQKVLHVESSVNYLKAQQRSKARQIDSLNVLIARLKLRFDSVLPPLNDSLWQKVIHHDLLLPLRRCIKYRDDELLDSYKKRIVEARKDMLVFENNYSDDLDSNIYKPGDFCFETGNRIFELIAVRNVAEFEDYKLKCQLVKFSEMTPAELDACRTLLLAENENDLCWIKGSDSYLRGIFYGYKALLGMQKGFDRMLTVENRSDARRYRIINNELNQRSGKYQRLVANNRKAVNVKSTEIRKSKNEYLKLLRDQRREARLNRR